MHENKFYLLNTISLYFQNCSFNWITLELHELQLKWNYKEQHKHTDGRWQGFPKETKWLLEYDLK